jgi:Tfp pilus assembly protein PilN
LIEINLLSSGEPRRAAARRAPTVRAPKMPAFVGDPWMAGLAAAGLLVLLLTAFSFWRTGARQTELHAQIEQEVADSARLSSTIALVEALKARQDTITQRIEVIRDVDRRRYVWPHLMDEISKSVPAFTWLGSLSSSESGDPAAPGPAITLQGNAGSTQALTRFMKNLEASPFIRDVTLVTSSQVTEAGREFQRFTLEAKYETPDSALIETVPIVVIE